MNHARSTENGYDGIPADDPLELVLQKSLQIGRESPAFRLAHDGLLYVAALAKREDVTKLHLVAPDVPDVVELANDLQRRRSGNLEETMSPENQLLLGIVLTRPVHTLSYREIAAKLPGTRSSNQINADIRRLPKYIWHHSPDTSPVARQTLDIERAKLVNRFVLRKREVRGQEAAATFRPTRPVETIFRGLQEKGTINAAMAAVFSRFFGDEAARMQPSERQLVERYFAPLRSKSVLQSIADRRKDSALPQAGLDALYVMLGGDPQNGGHAISWAEQARRLRTTNPAVDPAYYKVWVAAALDWLYGYPKASKKVTAATEGDEQAKEAAE